MWETESIAKIQVVAEAARIDLQEWTHRKTNEVKSLLDTIADELAASRKLNDYSEINLKGWIQRLKELQEIMNSSSNVDIVDEIDEASSIHFIKMKENRKHQQPSTFVRERFDKAIGAISLSEDDLQASHLDHIGSKGSTCGVNLYSSGIHCIRFQITGSWGRYFFFGHYNLITRDNPTSPPKHHLRMDGGTLMVVLSMAKDNSLEKAALLKKMMS